MPEPVKVEELIDKLRGLGLEPEDGGPSDKWYLHSGEHGAEPSLRLNVYRYQWPSAVMIADTLMKGGIQAESSVGEDGPYVSVRKSSFKMITPDNLKSATRCLRELLTGDMDAPGAPPIRQKPSVLAR